MPVKVSKAGEFLQYYDVKCKCPFCEKVHYKRMLLRSAPRGVQRIFCLVHISLRDETEDIY